MLLSLYYIIIIIMLILYAVLPLSSPLLYAFPTLSHGPITLFITQNGAEHYQNLDASTIQRKNWFWNDSQLINWLGILEISRD